MVKAGFSGSGIQDVVYMGQVVNRAAELAAEGSKGGLAPIVLDEDFAVWLNEHNREPIEYNYARDFYTSGAVNTLMNG